MPLGTEESAARTCMNWDKVQQVESIKNETVYDTLFHGKGCIWSNKYNLPDTANAVKWGLPVDKRNDSWSFKLIKKMPLETERLMILLKVGRSVGRHFFKKRHRNTI